MRLLFSPSGEPDLDRKVIEIGDVEAPPKQADVLKVQASLTDAEFESTLKCHKRWLMLKGLTEASFICAVVIPLLLIKVLFDPSPRAGTAIAGGWAGVVLIVWMLSLSSSRKLFIAPRLVLASGRSIGALGWLCGQLANECDRRALKRDDTWCAFYGLRALALLDQLQEELSTKGHAEIADKVRATLAGSDCVDNKLLAEASAIFLGRGNNQALPPVRSD